MKETLLPLTADAKSPAGAEIRFIMDGTTGNMIHSTVGPGQISRATVHSTVSEFWYVLEGNGEIWRRDEAVEKITRLFAGVSIDIPVGTAFQYRNVGTEPLKFVCTTMPPWPGDHEASHLEGAWNPTVNDR
jgi:mannose-6-phosphate isomerase-like protein (cupin superfamily)